MSTQFRWVVKAVVVRKEKKTEKNAKKRAGRLRAAGVVVVVQLVGLETKSSFHQYSERDARPSDIRARSVVLLRRPRGRGVLGR